MIGFQSPEAIIVDSEPTRDLRLRISLAQLAEELLEERLLLPLLLLHMRVSLLAVS